MNHGGNVWQGGVPGDYLDFSANIRPGGAPDWVLDALARAMEMVAYYPDPHMVRARAALAEYLNLPEEWVLPTAGGISAIDLAVHLKHRGMLALSPCFEEYAQQAVNLGVEVQQVSLLRAPHELKTLNEALKDQLFPNCALWVCNPLNPVGCGFSASEIGCLAQRIAEVKGHLLVDEAFIEYSPQNSAADLLGQNSHLVIAGSMTKILGIPGVRLGYLCAHPRILKALKRYQHTWELNCFAEAVLVEMPKHRASIRQEALKNALRREQLRQGLEALGAFVYPSAANFLLVDFGVPVQEIQRKLLKKRILVRDCRSFKGIDDGRHLRLAVKDAESNARLLAELKEAMACGENH